jgi:hypothetical protein
MDARKHGFHALLVVTLLVGLWLAYGEWLVARLA